VTIVVELLTNEPCLHEIVLSLTARCFAGLRLMFFPVPFLLRDAMLSRYMLSSCVCLSVRHMPVLHQNG